MTTGQDRIVVQNRIDFVTGAVRRYVGDVDAVARAGERARALLAGRTAAEAQADPAPGEWSACRALGHVVVYARLLRDQLTRMAWMTDPVLPVADDAGEAERHGWERRDPALLLEWLDTEIEAIGDLLKHLPDSSWGRAGLHPVLGRRAIVQQVRDGVAHVEAHLDQIEAALAGGGGEA